MLQLQGGRKWYAKGLNFSGIFVTNETMCSFTHEILLVLTVTVWHLNAIVAADGSSYLRFKCPFLYLSRTLFSFSSNKSLCNGTVFSCSANNGDMYDVSGSDCLYSYIKRGS